MKDKHLVSKAQSGDKSAFEELVRRYHDIVRLLAFSILEDQDEAEEIAQEAFLKAYARLDDLKNPSSFAGWLKRIACNMAINRLKQMERMRQVCLSLDEVSPEDLAVFPLDEDEEKEELIEEIMKAIEELPEEERGILKGRYLEGRGYRELADRYNLSYDAVVVRAHRARRKVREKVLRRLSGMMIFPWGKIGRMIGGVVMKVSTKVAITGVVVMMLAGAGIWLSHRGEEKPMPKSNEVRVERRVSVRAPAMVAGRPKRKKEDDFTFEEFNRLLDECLPYLDEGEKEDVREVAGESDETQEPLETQVSDETPSQREESKPDQERQRQIEELKERILQAAERYREILIRRKLLSQGKKYLFPGLTPEQENREYRQTQYELFDALLGYWALTEDLDPYLPGGWIYETVSGMASIRIGISSRGDECPVIGFTDDIARE